MDIAVAAIIIFFAFKGYFSGFVKMCFSFIPHIAGILAAYLLTPTVSHILRNTFLYKMMKKGVGKALNIEGAVAVNGGQGDVIDTLNIPSFLKDSLMENNNPVVYDLLDASEIGEYIAGYIANVCMNIIALILIFAVTFLIFKVILEALNIVAQLPVVSMLNSLGGVAAGVACGVFIIWLIGIVLVLFYSSALFVPVFEKLYESRLALPLYENNMLLFMVLKIFA